MSIKMEELADGKVLDVHISGKLATEDYQHFVPEVERLIAKNGKVRMVVEMENFHGWRAGALWQDIKFDLKHFSDIDRLAMVGEKKWQKAMSQFCRPFTTAKIQYFEHSAIAEARQWAQAA